MPSIRGSLSLRRPSDSIRPREGLSAKRALFRPAAEALDQLADGDVLGVDLHSPSSIGLLHFNFHSPSSSEDCTAAKFVDTYLFCQEKIGWCLAVVLVVSSS